VVVYTYSPSTWETEARGLRFQGFKAILGYIVQPCLKGNLKSINIIIVPSEKKLGEYEPRLGIVHERE
jgi:hypothetical protein